MTGNPRAQAEKPQKTRKAHRSASCFEMVNVNVLDTLPDNSVKV
jgi:hypothetical protein